MAAAALLVALGDHDASRDLDALLLADKNGEKSAISRVPVVSPSSPIQLPLLYHRLHGTQPLSPSRHMRLLIIMPIVENGIRQIALYLREYQRSQALLLDHLSFQPLDLKGLDPLLDVFSGLDVEPVRLPVLVVGTRKVGDSDVVGERRDDGGGELELDEFGGLLYVEAGW